MKKSILLFLIAFTFSFAGVCQIAKANWMIGGNATFNSTKTNGGDILASTTQTTVQVSGDVGFFLFDKFVAGLEPFFTSGRSKSGTNYIISQRNYGLGPFVRYYLLSPDNEYVNIFSEATFQFGFLDSRPNGSVLYYNRIATALGCEMFFNTSVGLEFKVGYANLNYAKSAASSSSIIAGIGFQFHLEKITNN